MLDSQVKGKIRKDFSISPQILACKNRNNQSWALSEHRYHVCRGWRCTHQHPIHNGGLPILSEKKNKKTKQTPKEDLLKFTFHLLNRWNKGMGMGNYHAFSHI